MGDKNGEGAGDVLVPELAGAVEGGDGAGEGGGRAVVVVGHDDEVVDNLSELIDLPNAVIVSSVGKDVEADVVGGVFGFEGLGETADELGKSGSGGVICFGHVLEVEVDAVETFGFEVIESVGDKEVLGGGVGKQGVDVVGVEGAEGKDEFGAR